MKSSLHLWDIMAGIEQVMKHLDMFHLILRAIPLLAAAGGLVYAAFSRAADLPALAVDISYALVATATATKHRRLPSDYDKGQAHGRR